jgi:Tol biopolymer transport system component
MSSDSRIERALPSILEDLGAGPAPDYTDVLLARSAATSQRPGWAIPERWFPMYAVSERVTAAPRLPLRAIAVFALLILALMTAVLVAGNRQPQLAPYGPAGNGMIAYDVEGDIFVGHVANGAAETRRITSGPEVDSYPGYSHDGTKIMFVRSKESIGLADHLMVVNADGSDLRQVTTDPIWQLTGGDWSGDGRSFVITSAVNGRQMMTIFDVESGAQRTLLTRAVDGLPASMPVHDVSFRPPDGAELLFVGDGAFGALEGRGIYVMGTDGSNLRRVVGPAEDLVEPHWSPDGSQIAYHTCVAATRRCFIHIVDAYGSGDEAFENPPGVIYQVSHGGWGSIWSPDGKSVLVGRGYWDGPAVVPPETEPDTFRLAILSVDGAVPDQELAPSGYSFGSGWGWSPDGTKVVWSRDPGDGGLRMLDVATGDETHQWGWYHASWQRVLSD